MNPLLFLVMLSATPLQRLVTNVILFSRTSMAAVVLLIVSMNRTIGSPPTPIRAVYLLRQTC